jgi:hypothetical protein
MTMAPPKPLFRLNFLAREASFGSLVGVEALGAVESGLRLVEPAPRSPEEATIVAASFDSDTDQSFLRSFVIGGSSRDFA